METKTNTSIEDRAARASLIIQHPERYKVCEGCESIVAARAATCPGCHGYRFDDSPERVVEQANILGSRERQSVIDEDFS